MPFLVHEAHIEQTGIRSEVPLIICEAAIVKNEHGADVTRTTFCPTKQYSTHQGSKGDLAGGTQVASIERDP